MINQWRIIAARAVLVLALALTSTLAPVSAKSAHRTLVEISEARDFAYAERYKVAMVEANSAIDLFTEAVSNGEAPEVVGRLFEAVMAKVATAHEVRGRGVAVNGFVTHFNEKPNPLESELWLQAQANDLKQHIRNVEQLEREAKAAPQSGDFLNMIKTTQEWIAAHSELLGKSEELQLISANLDSYHSERNRRDQSRRNGIRAFLSGLANGLRAEAPQSQFLTTTIHCQQYYSGVSCRTP